MRIIFFVLSVFIANTITAQGLFNTIVKEVTKIELTEEEVHFKFLLTRFLVNGILTKREN